MTQGQIINIKSTKHRFPTVCEYAGGRFRLTEEGVSFLGNDKEGNPLAPRWVCSPLYVVAKTRDAKMGNGVGCLNGRMMMAQRIWAMPLALLQGDASEVRRELARLGLTISPNKIARDLLATYLQVFPVEDRARCVDKLGWHNNLFVTPSQVIGDTSEKIVFQNSNTIESAMSVSGTLEDWQQSIGKLAVG